MSSWVSWAKSEGSGVLGGATCYVNINLLSVLSSMQGCVYERVWFEVFEGANFHKF